MALRIHAALAEHVTALQVALNLDCSEARSEVQCLLQAVLNVPRAYLLAHPEYELDPNQHAAYSTLLARRMRGEPVAYLLGEREFFGLNFKVTSATLIPRPDTELLVELALQKMPHAGRVLDLGTGSGAIALSIAHSRPDAQIVAVDASAAALQVARENQRALGIQNATFLLSDWYAELGEQRFDLIVTNPPYIAANDAHLAQGDVRFEPLSALVAGVDGLDDIRRIVVQAAQHLHPSGWLMMEHGYDQAERVREILSQANFRQIFSARDLSGIERVTAGQLDEISYTILK